MLYNNLIYFLVVILILTTTSIPDQPQIPFWATASIFILKAIFFRLALKKLFYQRRIKAPNQYATAEYRGGILAILIFAVDVYILDSQFYFAKLPIVQYLPSTTDLFGLALFSLYLALMWITSEHAYKKVFGRSPGKYSLILTNLRTNLPIVLPWLILSLLADLLAIAPIPAVHTFLDSTWGEPIIFLIFLAILTLLFPRLITRLWNCQSLPQSPARDLIESCCKQHQVSYKDILLWPLFEGQALTAGVMGFSKNFRYIMVTPALLKSLTPLELKAVIAHEIGHVKKRHLQLYMVIFLGFGLVAQLFTYPFLQLIADSNFFYKIVSFTDKEPGNALALASTVPMFVMMIVYFRFIMGFFMRNFERQADLYALTSLQSSVPLVTVFEKIAWLSGKTHNVPSWHHFSISQRINYLKQSEADPSLIKQHDKKLLMSLLTLFSVFLIATTFLLTSTDNNIEGSSREKYAEAVITQKIKEAPQNALLYQLLGDLQYSRKKYTEAITAYEQCLELAPGNYEVANNLAWLLLTVDDPTLKDQTRALELAKQAVIQNPTPQILDTLALAFWMNGSKEQAILAEQRAIMQKPAKISYYKMQLQKFMYTNPPSSH